MAKLRLPALERTHGLLALALVFGSFTALAPIVGEVALFPWVTAIMAFVLVGALAWLRRARPVPPISLCALWALLGLIAALAVSLGAAAVPMLLAVWLCACAALELWSERAVRTHRDA